MNQLKSLSRESYTYPTYKYGRELGGGLSYKTGGRCNGWCDEVSGARSKGFAVWAKRVYLLIIILWPSESNR